MSEEKKRCEPLGEFVSDFRREGGCAHRVKIFYESEISGNKQLPYQYAPFPKLGRRMPLGTHLVSFDRDEGYYEFEAISEKIQDGIDYLRAFGKQRHYKATKVEIKFTDDREVYPSD